MLRTFVGSLVLLVLAGGLVLGEDTKDDKKAGKDDKHAVQGLITAVTGTDVTIHVHKKGEEKGKTTTYAHSADVPVFKVTGTKKDHKKEKSSIQDLKAAIEASTGKHKGVHGHIRLDKDDKRAVEISYHVAQPKP